MEKQTIHALKETLFKRINILTPNIPEAGSLLNRKITSLAEMAIAAKDLCQLGSFQVILKGGHCQGDWAQDIWTDGSKHAWLTLPRLAGKMRGTGCVFSAALAAFLALGYTVLDAFVQAKMAIHAVYSRTAAQLPWLTFCPIAAQHRLPFAPCTQKIGLYPVVESVAWIKKCAQWGAHTLQLRLKNGCFDEYHDKIQQAVKITQAQQVPFFVNDYWQLAMQTGAYGVHLGQEDLEHCDMAALHAAGLRLGISTHSYAELARAHAFQPSYIALGPIYPTTAKIMKFGPQGLHTLKKWRQMVAAPLVAIGGINLENLAEVLACGVDGVAIISALTQAKDPFLACQQFLVQV